MSPLPPLALASSFPSYAGLGSLFAIMAGAGSLGLLLLVVNLWRPRSSTRVAGFIVGLLALLPALLFLVAFRDSASGAGFVIFGGLAASGVAQITAASLGQRLASRRRRSPG